MEWTEALEIVMSRTPWVGRYRELCAESHPDHLKWRRLMVAKATGAAPQPVEYPTLFRQALNLTGAVIRSAASGFKFVDSEELARRTAICAACPKWDAAKKRCPLCGCKTQWKLKLATEQCPLPEPKW